MDDKFLIANWNNKKFHKSVRNGFVSIFGAFIGWLIFNKLNVPMSEDVFYAIQSISLFLGVFLSNIINYFFNIWRIKD